MRTLTTTIIALALVSCGGSSPPRIDWPAVVACSDAAQADLLATVLQLLLDRATDPSAQLEQLAAQHTPHVVACVVDQAVAQLTAIAAAPPQPQARAMSAESPGAPVKIETTGADVAATRGRDFLQRVGTRVEDTKQ
jgi:hypothetical protein